MGIVLYLLAAVVELVSIALRFYLGRWLGGPVLGYLLGYGPIVWSIANLFGVRGGGWLTRYEFGARVASRRERAVVEPELVDLYACGEGVRGPTAWYVVDQPEHNASVVGTTLYITRELIRTPYLRSILAHELGHLNSVDGRLVLALRRLALPGSLALGRVLFLDPTTNQPYRLGCWLWTLKVLYYLVAGGISSLILAIPLANYWRGREYQADRAAALLGEAHTLADALEHVALTVDFATPWVFLTDRSHPPTELRIDRLLQYAGATTREELLAVPGAGAEDRLALGGTTLVFGSVGLLFALVCGVLPLFTGLMAAEARSVRQRVVTSVVQGVGQAGQQVVQGAVPAIAGVSSRSTSVAQRSWTAANGETVACDGTYFTKYSAVGIQPEPAATGRVTFLPLGTRVRLVCDEHLSSGWVRLEAAEAQGWTTTTYLAAYLSTTAPATPTPVPTVTPVPTPTNAPTTTVRTTASSGQAVPATSTRTTTGLVCGRTYLTNPVPGGDGIPLLDAPKDGAQPRFGLGDNQQVTILCAPAAAGWLYVVSGPAHGWLPAQAAITIFRPSSGRGLATATP